MPGVAIVTGASQGIGRAIACRLVRDGFKVALNDLPSQRSELEALRGDLLRSGNETFISAADVSVEGEVKAMIGDVVSNMGGLDVVRQPSHRKIPNANSPYLFEMVANAGICITKPLIESEYSLRSLNAMANRFAATKEDLDRILSINVNGTFLCYKYAALQMIKQGRGGKILGAASLAGKKGTQLLDWCSASVLPSDFKAGHCSALIVQVNLRFVD